MSWMRLPNSTFYKVGLFLILNLVLQPIFTQLLNLWHPRRWWKQIQEDDEHDERLNKRVTIIHADTWWNDPTSYQSNHVLLFFILIDSNINDKRRHLKKQALITIQPMIKINDTFCRHKHWSSYRAAWVCHHQCLFCRQSSRKTLDECWAEWLVHIQHNTSI